jgi:hypothetical protein
MQKEASCLFQMDFFAMSRAKKTPSVRGVSNNRSADTSFDCMMQSLPMSSIQDACMTNLFGMYVTCQHSKAHVASAVGEISYDAVDVCPILLRDQDHIRKDDYYTSLSLCVTNIRQVETCLRCHCVLFVLL